ncbi:BRO family protein [Roseibacterium sp. SDUM158016]|uniref:BRO-N domain-containing protein n=1 Tax=Roseicyclus sediminis TaxID=2980997 RepID=UPI0021D1E2BE|nr:BRO family protein [Roseibacterium sp. SDUM158016]MCU4652250.1 BRO family protein [Roseibacterium sp. SDUM158016]
MLTTYDFNQNSIRVIEIDGQPWFFARDCADLLGFKTTAGAGWYTRHLDDDEVNTITVNEGRRGNPRRTVISESGLYKLIMRSDRPTAKPFQDWVTRVVLPAIRKDGAYVSGEEKVTTGEMSDDELVRKAMSILDAKIERLRKERAVIQKERQQVAIMERRL